MKTKKQYKYASVLGANGSGKGTVCEILHDEHGNNGGFVHVGMSHVLELRCARDKKFAAVASGYMARQELVPDPLLKDALGEYLKHVGIHRRILFDGVPRSYQQARDHYDLLCRREKNEKLVVIVFEADEELILDRCRKRYLKKKRLDDSSDERILKRYWKFLKDLPPILDFYRARGVRIEPVDAKVSREEQLAAVHGILN